MRSDGTIACWGIGMEDAPTGSFVELSMRGEYACAIDAAGDHRCWGYLPPYY
ncbi:MAG TPA: hypothetical protein VN033_12430 [Vulgatibacter sp.]|nr:hypothetical protein [Vulgatibacter sp.]